MTTAENTMSIGEVAQISDTPATTLRYYERQGLIDPPARIAGQRRYDESVLSRLMVIKFCRIAGLSLDQVARVLADRSPQRRTTKQLAHDQIALIDIQLGELQLARRMMEAVTTCVCANVEDCECTAMDAVRIELASRLD